MLPRSHKDTAQKAFARVTKSVLPASHTQLERAIAAEARAHERRVAQLDEHARTNAESTTAAADEDVVVDDEDLGAGPDPADDLEF